MIRDVQIFNYLSEILKEFREMKIIMETENEEILKLWESIESALNNQFISSCDLKGIGKFEKLLNIVPSGQDTLESRISRVMIRWNDVVPYTLRVLMQKLTTLCGDDFKIIPNFNQYEIKIITHLDLYGQVDELQNLLDYIMPANIVVISQNDLNYEINGSANMAFTMSGTAQVTLSDSFNAHFEVNGNANIASGASFTEISGIK
jgi:hypothetical protein